MKPINVFSILILSLIMIGVTTGCETISGEYKRTRDQQWPDVLVVDAPSDTILPPYFEKLLTPRGLDYVSRILEETTRPFSTTYFTDGQSQHIAVFLEIVNGALQSPSVGEKYEISPGSLPYSPPGAGVLYVIYRRVDGSEVGRRTINDPLTVRVCDSAGNGPLGIVPIRNGSAEILIPYDPGIDSIELKRASGESNIFHLN